MISWLVLGILIAVGIYDLYLYFNSKRTLSQVVHAWFPKWIDALIMCGLLAATWAVWGIDGFLPVMLGVIVGHLFWYADSNGE